MKTTSMQVRVCSFLFAVLTSMVVLGGTVIGMQPDGSFAPPTMAMETVTSRTSAVG
ncbi:MAG: hypothetical protein ACXWUM_05650 [Burkholderiaceae bacterium]